MANGSGDDRIRHEAIRRIPGIGEVVGNPRGFAWSLAMGLIPGVSLPARDRALAFAMALSGSPEKVARILMANPGAAKACEFSMDDLAMVMDVTRGRFDRLGSLAELEVERVRWSGWLHWTLIDDLNLILLSATRIPAPARIWLNAKLHPIPGGWVMPPRWVSRFVAVTPAPVRDESGLLEVAADASLATAGQVTKAFPAHPSHVKACRHANGVVTLDWTDPFKPAGERIRRCVKLVGGSFNGDSNTWDVPEDRMPRLLAGLAWDHEVILEDLDAFLEGRSLTDDEDGERVAAGLVTAHLVQEDAREVRFRLSDRHHGLWDVAKSFGSRFQKGVHILPAMALGDFVKTLESTEGVEDMGLVSALARHEARAFSLDQQAASIKIPDASPTGIRLFRHQKDGVDFLARASGKDGLKGGILADDMGMGKSAQSILAADLTHAKRGPVLVLAPAALKLSWRDEIVTWLGADKRIFVAEGQTPQPLPDGMEWIICGLETVSYWVQALIEAGPSLAIIDEAQRIGTRTTQMAHALFGLRKQRGLLPMVPAVWCLTGTPIQNRPLELHNMLRAIDHPLGDDYLGYGKRYCDGKNNGHGWNFKGASNLSELAEILKPFVLRRMKTDTLGLPERIVKTVRVALDGESLAAYNRGVAALLAKSDEGVLVGQITLMKRMTALAKAPIAMDMAKDVVDSGGKVVVFSEYPEVLDRIAAGLPKSACVRVDGSVPTSERKAIEDRFQSNPKIKVFLGQLKAAGVGFNLTAAQDVIVVDLPWNPKALQQAEDRVHRIGSHGVVTVRRLLAEGTLDYDLFEVLQGKEAMVVDFEGGLIRDAAVSDEASSIIRAVIRRVRSAKGIRD